MRVHFDEEKNNLKAKHTQLMAAFAELDPDPVFRFDEEGKIILANDAGLELKKNGSIIGKDLHSIIPEIKTVNLQEIISNGEKKDLISKIDGKFIKFTLNGFPEMKIGQIYGSDITELKETETQLVKALNKAEDSEKIKSYFLAQMSHEIRSPLTAILGFNSMINEEVHDKINEDLHFAFHAIESSGKRLTRTIDQLLNMSQLQTGTYEARNDKLDLVEIISAVIKECEAEANEKKLQLLFENETEDAFIYGDGYAVNQIILNFIDNAVKYTDRGFVKIRLANDEKSKFVIHVEDSGIGISKEYLETLFTPFSQEVMGYNRPFEGNGLGLALCKRFADFNNAKIQVQSIKNKGTIFTLKFNE